jgi:hypothetical protein
VKGKGIVSLRLPVEKLLVNKMAIMGSKALDKVPAMM